MLDRRVVLRFAGLAAVAAMLAGAWQLAWSSRPSPGAATTEPRREARPAPPAPRPAPPPVAPAAPEPAAPGPRTVYPGPTGPGSAPSPTVAPRPDPAPPRPQVPPQAPAQSPAPASPSAPAPEPLPVPPQTRPAEPAAVPPRAAGGVDLNTASVEELNGLGGGQIGRAIVRGRPYSSPGDLLAKRVLSRSTYERIKDRVVVR